MSLREYEIPYSIGDNKAIFDIIQMKIDPEVLHTNLSDITKKILKNKIDSGYE